MLTWLHNLFLKVAHRAASKDRLLSAGEQLRNWSKANRKMDWGINRSEFERMDALPLPTLTDEDQARGFIGSVIFYGFGEDGEGNSDAVLSGKLAWGYAAKNRKNKIWQCEYLDFNKADDIRLRTGAPPRPKGFYFAKITNGERYKAMTVTQVRKTLTTDTGWGPEGFQFLAITHPHFADLMNKRRIAFMALADYDVAPYGYNDFYDAPQLFCSNNKLGLGIGNVDRNYPLFGIPTLQLCGMPQV